MSQGMSQGVAHKFSRRRAFFGLTVCLDPVSLASTKAGTTTMGPGEEPSSYFMTSEYEALWDRLVKAETAASLIQTDDTIEHIRRLHVLIADGRWHFDNPGKLGCWRLSIEGRVIEANGLIPRFETRMDAVVFISRFPGHPWEPMFLPSEAVIRRLLGACFWITPQGVLIGGIDAEG